MSKTSNQKTFDITRKLRVKAWTYETRYSWGHKAELFIDGEYITNKKITYYNRTWEAYTYQSILDSILDKALKEKGINQRQYTHAKKWVNTYQESNGLLKMTAMIAKMGEVLADDNIKAKNDWKARMLKAGLENHGLIMPDDWDDLSEVEKQRRLDGAIDAIK